MVKESLLLSMVPFFVANIFLPRECVIAKKPVLDGNAKAVDDAGRGPARF
jgi:hypothetical protein